MPWDNENLYKMKSTEHLRAALSDWMAWLTGFSVLPSFWMAGFSADASGVVADGVLPVVAFAFYSDNDAASCIRKSNTMKRRAM
ncbi:unnamed protein product [Gongylonema pulchrum]|uniref:Transmembrane protein n=1 Tax=Gongylonema pulchrum TaxID=637853 RepID=A0A183CVK3_9BILA|nr:unnamed protein product [Gongylonema pulchrum]